MYYFKESYASRTALASWSGQEVGFLPHFMPLTFFSICSTVSPSTSERTAWRFPLHPPVKFTLVIISPSISNSINEEQVPFVLYVYFIITSFLPDWAGYIIYQKEYQLKL